MDFIKKNILSVILWVLCIVFFAANFYPMGGMRE